jgi:hypothetical protein
MTPSPAPDPAAAWARRFHLPFEAVHIVGYFAPETTEAYLDAGLTDYGMGYFASRSAAMGAVPPELTAATFFVFSPALVAAFLPRAWELLTPDEVLKARADGIEEALRRGLGELADSPEVAQAAAITNGLLDGLTVAGRPLAAAHRRLPVPELPLMALWHAATVLREHRGDGHVAALVLAGLDPVEALITAVAAGASAKFLKTTRGWSPEQWADGERRLRERGLLDDEAQLTPAGQQMRKGVEDATDAAAADPYRRLGEDGCQELMDLLLPLARAIAAAGVVPKRLLGPILTAPSTP